ncbi:MAG: hypothetical protein AB8G77_11320 [Rhodothermales bacterium]
MTLPILNPSVEYDALRDAAETFGFHNEAALIAQKANEQEEQFTLLLMGQRGAGKSTVINLLLGKNIATIDTPNNWINVFCRSDEKKEYAEIHTSLDQEPIRKMPIAQAQALARNQKNLSSSHATHINRIVWHLNAPGLPKNVAITEMPDMDEPAITKQLLWQADGVILVFKAEHVNDEQSLELAASYKEHLTLPVTSMGIITHMESIPRKRWIQVLQLARTTIGQHLDVVVPCSKDPDELEVVLQGSNALLHREIRNRFFSSAPSLKRQNQALFATAMRDVLATQFESYVDRVLNNRWICQRFKADVDDKLNTISEELQTRIHRFVDEQKHVALARAAALDGFNAEQRAKSLARKDGTSSDEFGKNIYQYIFKSTQHLFAGLEFDKEISNDLKIRPVIPQDSTQKDTDLPTISFKLPQVPLNYLAMLCGEVDGDIMPSPSANPSKPARSEWDGQSLDQEGFDTDLTDSDLLEMGLGMPGFEGDGMTGESEISIFEPSTGYTGKPLPADRWVTATEWLPGIAMQAEEELNVWLNATIKELKRNLNRSAEQTFRSIHGYLPNEVPVVLMPLEQTYSYLNNLPSQIPTPHLPGDSLSPVLFLCRMQEPEFIDLWNRQLIQRCFDYVIPRLERQLIHDIEYARNEMTEQWQGSKESIHKRIDIVWKKYGRRLAMKSAVKWSIPWVSTLMRDRLMDPVQHLTRTRLNVRAPYEYPVSFFLHKNNSEFLQPIDRPVDRPLTPDQYIVELIQKKIRKSAKHIWRNKKPILISLPLRKKVRKRSAQALGMLFGFSLLWIMMFGTSNMSLIAFSVIALPYVGITGMLIKRLMDRMYESGSEIQTERIYNQIQHMVEERLDNLRRHINGEIRNDDLWDEVMSDLKTHEAPAAGSYLPYKELIKRVEAMQDKPAEQESADG